MPPRPGQSSSAGTPTPLAIASKGTAKSAADLATEASQRITAQREKTKTRKVRVVATKEGYDGLTVWPEGKHGPWLLAEGEKLPSWLMLEKDYDAMKASEDGDATDEE